MKRITLFLIAMMPSIMQMNAHDFEAENNDGVTIYYKVVNGEAVVTYKGDWSGDYDDEYTGVVNIPPSVYYRGTVYIIYTIGKDAFRECKGLTHIIFPTDIKKIEDNAFYGCSGLTSVILPNSLTSIGDDAFVGCSALTAIDVVSVNIKYSSEDGVLFNATKTELIQYPIAKGSSYSIPNSITSIGIRAFFDCSGLTSVTLPNSLASIESWAFAWSGLKTITLPHSLISIKNGAFYGCNSLTDVTVFWDIPSEVALSQELGENVFGVVNTNAVTLHVPPGTKAVYQSADVWKDFNIVDDAVTAVQTPSVAAGHIYYNSADESFRITGIHKATDITVNDLSGKTVLHRMVALGEAVPVGNLPQGIYIVHAAGKTMKITKR